MKKETLGKISNEKYYVKGNCTFKKGVGKICNFYISEVTLFERLDKSNSFEITLKSENKETETNAFPISYLHDPLSWIYDFDVEDFRMTTTKKDFEKSMIEIINFIIYAHKYDVLDEDIGWNIKKIKESTVYEKTEFFFGKFDSPGDSIDLKQNKPQNYLYEYMKLADINVSAPLFSYMLLSLLTSLRFLGPDTKACFNVALVGGSKEVRRIFALFFANLYRRDPHFYKNEYMFFHINEKDSFANIRYKARSARDCVLIAFEPDKRHLNSLTNNLYARNVIDNECPIENLLLYTGSCFEKNAPGNTLVITLNNEHNTKAIEDYFNNESYNHEEDHLMDCIYFFIQELTKKILKKNNCIHDKFKKFHDNFLENTPCDLSKTAQEVATLLLFALTLYDKCFGKEDEYIYRKAFEYILSTVRTSFPIDGQVTEKDFDNAKNVCCHIDSYFKSKTNKSIIGKIGSEKTVLDKRIWYNEEKICFTLTHIREILKLTNCTSSYSESIKKALAEKNIIKTYTKDGKIVEYTVRLQEKLTETETTSKRYVAFNRNVCREYNLFPTLEEICKK